MKRILTCLVLVGGLLALVGGGGVSQGASPLGIIPQPSELQINVWVDKDVYRIGERIHVYFSVNQQAHIYIVDIEPGGRTTLIFPSCYARNNFMGPGEHVVPPDRWQVAPPAGTEQIQAIASLEPLDLGIPTFAECYPYLGGSPQEAGAAIQGIVPSTGVATAWTSFQIVTGGPVNRPPVASFSFSPTSPMAGQSVTFDAYGSYDPDGRVTGYAWDFNGDGRTDARGVTATHSFAAAGSYRVQLTVTDNGGLTDSITRVVQVSGPANRPPVPSFSFSPYYPMVGQPVALNAGSSYDPDGWITDFRWDFDSNGTIDARGRQVTHAFYRSGSHPVTLTVWDNRGASASITHTVTVQGYVPPTPSAAGFYVNIEPGNIVHITVQGSSSWYLDHSYRIDLETDGSFLNVSQQTSGGVSPLGIVPAPVPQNTLSLSGSVSSGQVDYYIRLSDDATKIKFKLQLDQDGDGDLDLRTGNVYLGPSMSHPRSNPFVLSFPSGTLSWVQAQMCIVLIDQPGFQFIVCFNFNP